MTPKGKLLIIGGGEDKGDPHLEDIEIKEKNKDFKHFEILNELLPGDGDRSVIEVITTASEIPEEMIGDYKKAFKKAGFTNIRHLNIQTKEDARDKKYVKRR